MIWIILLALVLGFAIYRFVRRERPGQTPSEYGRWQREQREREKEQAKPRPPSQQREKPRSFSADH